MNHLIYDVSNINVKVDIKLLAIKEGLIKVESENAPAGRVRVITVGDGDKAGKVMDAVWVVMLPPRASPASSIKKML